jgi:hypothetical protein
MWFLCIKYAHSHMSFKKMSHLCKYLKYWIRVNIIHINHNTKFMWFLYKPMKIRFRMKFVQTYETWLVRDDWPSNEHKKESNEPLHNIDSNPNAIPSKIQFFCTKMSMNNWHIWSHASHTLIKTCPISKINASTSIILVYRY